MGLTQAEFWYSYIRGETAKKAVVPTRQRPYCLTGRKELGLPLLLLKVSTVAALPPLRFKLKWHFSLRPLSFLLILLVVTKMESTNTILAALRWISTPWVQLSVGQLCLLCHDNCQHVLNVYCLLGTWPRVLHLVFSSASGDRRHLFYRRGLGATVQ